MDIMESWSYTHGGKAYISSSDNFLENTGFISGQQALDSVGFGEFVNQEFIDLTTDTSVIDYKVKESSVDSPISISLEDDSNCRLSSSTVDLKLGRFNDPKYYQVSGTWNLTGKVKSPKSVRIGMNSQAASCLVFGCNKDLSSSKEYHKRHKVCEVHSKAANAIVNGRVQRFCQQCSRFHLLAEFDNGKRSCRKRLQDHNERRRKPQSGIHSARTEKLFKTDHGGSMSGKSHGTTFSASSFISQDKLPDGLFHPEEYAAKDWCRQIKTEDGTNFTSLQAIPMKGSVYDENSKGNSRSNESLNHDSTPLYQDASLGSHEDFTPLGSASAFQEIWTIAQSAYAPSLLSPQSSNSSGHSSGIRNVQYNMRVEEGIRFNPFENIEAMNGTYHRSYPSNCEDSLYSEDGSTINLFQLSSQLQRVEQQKQSTQAKEDGDSFYWPHIA